MAKRPAEESVESLSYRESPTIKKVRVDFPPEGVTRSNGFNPPEAAPIPINGREYEQDERNGKDILAAADQLREEMQEATLSSPELESENEEDVSALKAPARQTAPVDGYGDLYLDTINRAVLDFDFEKLCSVSLANVNVYACLVCGKYFQGRGPSTHAYFHALEIGHHVYVNMATRKVYVLPEGYEVKSKSLDDIKFVVDPRLSKDDVAKLDKEPKDAWDLVGKKYRPGSLSSLELESSF
jgi:U4/U6.U5 tri-snRNP-associated protein 2